MNNIGRPKTEKLYPSNFNLGNGVKQLQNKYIALWRRKLKNSEKFNFYRKVKSNYEPENYLRSVRNILFRKELTKQRISNRNLLIERGRYCFPKLGEERLCSICSEYI